VVIPNSGRRVAASIHHIFTTAVVGQYLGTTELVAVGLSTAVINIFFITTINGIGIAVHQ